MVSETFKILFFGVVAIAVASAASYWVATLGHPSAVWLWRDMLGLL